MTDQTAQTIASEMTADTIAALDEAIAAAEAAGTPTDSMRRSRAELGGVEIHCDEPYLSDDPAVVALYPILGLGTHTCAELGRLGWTVRDGCAWPPVHGCRYWVTDTTTPGEWESMTLTRYDLTSSGSLSPARAAEIVAGWIYEPGELTYWVHLECIDSWTGQDLSPPAGVPVHPVVPECCAETHDWASPHSVLGGLEESPGVVGHGGGVVITEVCRHCGTYRERDTWATDRATGEQGMEAVSYRAADTRSLEWAR